MKTNLLNTEMMVKVTIINMFQITEKVELIEVCKSSNHYSNMIIYGTCDKCNKEWRFEDSVVNELDEQNEQHTRTHNQ